VTPLFVEPLTRESFAPFGDVIEPVAGGAALPGGEAVNAGTSRRHEAVPALDLLREGARAVLAVYEAAAQALPLAAREVERHRLSDQVFLPLGAARRCVVLVAAAEGEPAHANLRGFVTDGHQGVRIRAGTWHHGLISLDAGPWAVIERRALDGAVDCDVRALAHPVLLTDPPPLPEPLRQIAEVTKAHYAQDPHGFWQATREHDVSQNIAALLRHLHGAAPAATGATAAFDILDLGCGPGRDLKAFRDLGHRAVGLDGTAAFVTMAQAHSGCEVWLQDLLTLQLPPARFDGIFANAVLFHVPTSELPRVLGELRRALRPRGVLFVSNPRGEDHEGWQGDRYGVWHSLEGWRRFVREAGFEELEHYLRPAGQPPERQPWLATVWQRAGGA